jgi:alkylation response protein AidB-like acyl-CoA dehydrogenase
VLFELDPDQRQWQDTVRKVVGKECPPELVRAVSDRGADVSGLWKVYTDLGWTEISDPETTIELAIVLEELGRAVDPTPYLATTTQFAPLAPGVLTPGQTGTAVWDGVTARADGDGFVLAGTARHVLDGDRADHLAVVTDAGVFVLAADAVTATRTSSFDPMMHLADVTVDGVRVAASDATGADREQARQLALTGMALTMVGACRRILGLALEHVKTREQFGVHIGSFGAVQTKAADMHVAIERANALAYFAALTIASDDPRRRIAASMAKASAGECQGLVFRHGLQLFGGMGFTWENDLQFALKRAKAGELLLGGAVQHRALIAEEYRAAQL